MPIARMCQERMESLGWIAHVMVDPTEWESIPDDVVIGHYSTNGLGMYGNQCAKAIMDGMIANSEGDEVIMKMDCDVWISREAGEWLSGHGQAKAMRITHKGKSQAWGGMWSATRQHVISARKIADTMERCQCPESWLNIRALYLSAPSIRVKSQHVTQWYDGIDRGYVATLPINLRHDRINPASRLFDTTAL